MYYCAIYLVALGHIFRKLILKKIYNTYLNNIDMVLLRTSYRYEGFF